MRGLEQSDSPYARAVIRTKLGDVVRTWNTYNLHYGGERPRSIKQADAVTANLLHKAVDGRGLLEASRVPEANGWVLSQSRLQSGRAFIDSVKVRGNLLPTGSRSSRGRRGPGNDGWCDAGCRSKESLNHISQACVWTHGGTVRRHDTVSRFVCGRLRQRGFTAIEEPRIPTRSGIRKPDIIADKNGKPVVLDTQIKSDTLKLAEEHARKRRYYDTPDVLDWVRSKFGSENMPLVSTITLSRRGVWAPESATMLRELGLSQAEQRLISVMVVEKTAVIFREFKRSTLMRTAQHQ